MAAKEKKILIVDDDRDLVGVLMDRLGFEGFETIAACEGVRAIEAAHRQKPDLILLDLQMPAGDGQTVLRSLKSRPETQRIPVLVLTGMDSEHVEEEVRAAGGQDLLRKPYDMEVLLQRIRSLLTH